MTHPLLDGFDRICIINLADRTDRRRAVTRELQQLGVAVDGVRVRFFAAVRPDGPADFPSTGARGCYLSHLAVLRQARADGVQRLLVLEDDVMFSAEMARANTLAGTLQGRQQTGLQDNIWHLAYLGHVQPALPGPLRWQATSEPLVCAHCYAVNGPALHRLVTHLEACLDRPAGHPLGGAMHVDGAFSLLRQQQPGLVTLLASRSLAGQRSSRSDIIGPSWLDRLPLAGLLRGVKNRVRRLAGAV